MPEQSTAFKTIIELINENLSVLSRNGYKIYDADNQGYFLQRVYYCKDDNRIKFTTEED